MMENRKPITPSLRTFSCLPPHFCLQMTVSSRIWHHQQGESHSCDGCVIPASPNMMILSQTLPPRLDGLKQQRKCSQAQRIWAHFVPLDDWCDDSTSRESSHKVCVTTWPNGEGVWLRFRRLRVWVPSWWRERSFWAAVSSVVGGVAPEPLLLYLRCC